MTVARRANANISSRQAGAYRRSQNRRWKKGRAFLKWLEASNATITWRLRGPPRPAPELLFEVFSQRYERGSTVVTSNLPFDEWTSVFGFRAAHRCVARPAHPSRPYPAIEWRQNLQAQSEQAPITVSDLVEMIRRRIGTRTA